MFAFGWAGESERLLIGGLKFVTAVGTGQDFQDIWGSCPVVLWATQTRKVDNLKLAHRRVRFPTGGRNTLVFFVRWWMMEQTERVRTDLILLTRVDVIFIWWAAGVRSWNRRNEYHCKRLYWEYAFSICVQQQLQFQRACSTECKRLTLDSPLPGMLVLNLTALLLSTSYNLAYISTSILYPEDLGVFGLASVIQPRRRRQKRRPDVNFV